MEDPCVTQSLQDVVSGRKGRKKEEKEAESRGVL
jgi:hypothetical protein